MPQAAHARRILVLSAAMGGGHTQIANELRRRLAGRGHEVRVVDLLDLMPPPTGRWLHDLYPWLVNRVPWLYQRVYDVFFTARQKAGERAGIPVRLAVPGLRRLVREFRPDVAVSTYPLSALALARLRGRGELGCPAVTVITTFSVNNLWLHPAADAELCISDDAADDVRRRTGRPGQVCGPIIRPAFEELRAHGRARQRAEVRRRLGIPEDGHVALVTTGSMGLAGSAAAAATAIARRPGWIPLVVCGRNEELCERMRRIDGAVVLGWADDMPALMAASDVLVDNNCGMAAKEALGVGLPVVTFRPLAGHGKDDVAAVARLGLTDVVTEEDELADAVERLVRDEARRRDRIARGRSLFVADAADLVERHAGVPAAVTVGDTGGQVAGYGGGTVTEEMTDEVPEEVAEELAEPAA